MKGNIDKKTCKFMNGEAFIHASVKGLTTHTFDLASSSAFTRKPPCCESVSRPDADASSVLGSRPTETIT
jgi:hypothetical protein